MAMGVGVKYITTCVVILNIIVGKLKIGHTVLKVMYSNMGQLIR